MVEIDGGLLGYELAISGLLVVQFIFAPVSGILGYLSGRLVRPRWAWVGFLLALLLAVAACGGTLYQCSEARSIIQGRLQGRIPGPNVAFERAANNLDFVWMSGLASVTTLAVTLIGSGFLHRRARWRRTRISAA